MELGKFPAVKVTILAGFKNTRAVDCPAFKNVRISDLLPNIDFGYLWRGNIFLTV